MRLRRFRPIGCWMTSSRTFSTKSSEQAIAVAGWCGRLGDRITTKLLRCMSLFLAQSGHHDCAEPYPLSEVKRTYSGHRAMCAYSLPEPTIGYARAAMLAVAF